MGVGRCLGLEGMEEGGFGASQEGWLLVVMLLIIIKILLFVRRRRRRTVFIKIACIVRSLLGLFLYPCTLPTAPVSRSFGLRSSYESVSLTPTKDQGKWNVTPLTAQRDPLAFAFLLLIHLKLGTHTSNTQKPKTNCQLCACVNCLLCNHTHPAHSLQYAGITQGIQHDPLPAFFVPGCCSASCQPSKPV